MVNPEQLSKRILVIDDDKQTRYLTQKLLESEGYETINTASSLQAEELIEAFNPDLVLLDVIIPERTGYDVCESLRKSQKYANLPILMMTGLNDSESIEKAYKSGATDFITKPLKLALLKHRIRYMLRASKTMAELNKSLEQVQYLAYYDPLTGLPNRQQFSDRLQEKVQVADERQQKLAVFFIDLDDFKRINDTLGHTAGDLLLRELGERFTGSIRRSDFDNVMQNTSGQILLARFGGDEFTLFVEDIQSRVNAEKIAQRLLERFKKPILIQNQEIVITASIGFSLFPDDGHDAEELLKKADTAMYISKNQGRSRSTSYLASMNLGNTNSLELEHDLRYAITKNEIVGYYQPRINLHTQKISGAEVLLRWHHPTLGIIPPLEFIGLADRLELMIPITENLLKMLMDNIRQWQPYGIEDMKFSINITALHFNEPNFAENIISSMDKYNIPHQMIELEITEHALMKETAQTINTLKQLSAAGIDIAIDDFGTGYSSLNYLKQFPVRRLKIDREFVHDIESNPDDQIITKTIITMARNFNLEVTAEGIETTEQLAILNQLGCDEVQGFLFSQAVTSSSFQELLKLQSKDKSLMEIFTLR